MGNFQQLAEKILDKNNPCFNKVSSFLPLAGETGNFQGKSGNSIGNFEHANQGVGQCSPVFKEETCEETSRKLGAGNQETFAAKNNDKSFLINHGTAGLLDVFF